MPAASTPQAARAGNHFFSASPTNSKIALVPGSVGQADLRVDLVVGGFPGAVDPDRDARALEHAREALRLGARVGMVGDMHDQERRNAFVAGHVGHGGKVAMLRRVVAELLAVAVRRLRLSVSPTAGLRGPR